MDSADPVIRAKVGSLDVGILDGGDGGGEGLEVFGGGGGEIDNLEGVELQHRQ